MDRLGLPFWCEPSPFCEPYPARIMPQTVGGASNDAVIIRRLAFETWPRDGAAATLRRLRSTATHRSAPRSSPCSPNPNTPRRRAQCLAERLRGPPAAGSPGPGWLAPETLGPGSMGSRALRPAAPAARRNRTPTAPLAALRKATSSEPVATGAKLRVSQTP